MPLFGQQVAPRFGFANQFLIADIEDGQISNEQNHTTVATSWLDRIIELNRFGVNVILCGGYDQRFVPLAQSQGISVRAGVWGDARVALATLAVEVHSRCRKRRRRGARRGPGCAKGTGTGTGDKPRGGKV